MTANEAATHLIACVRQGLVTHCLAHQPPHATPDPRPPSISWESITHIERALDTLQPSSLEPMVEQRCADEILDAPTFIQNAWLRAQAATGTVELHSYH
jgi:hypothetical protein